VNVECVTALELCKFENTRAWQERLVTPYIMWAVSMYRAGSCRIGVVEVGLGVGFVKNRIGRSDLGQCRSGAIAKQNWVRLLEFGECRLRHRALWLPIRQLMGESERVKKRSGIGGVEKRGEEVGK